MNGTHYIDGGHPRPGDEEPLPEDITTAYAHLVWDSYQEHLGDVQFPYLNTAIHRRGNYNPAILTLTTPEGLSVGVRLHQGEDPPKIDKELANGPKVDVSPLPEISPNTGELRHIKRTYWVDAEGVLHYRNEDMRAATIVSDAETVEHDDPLETIREVMQEARNRADNRNLAVVTGLDSGACNSGHITELAGWLKAGRPTR